MNRFSAGATLVYDGIAFGFRPDNEIACGVVAQSPEINESEARVIADHAQSVYVTLTQSWPILFTELWTLKEAYLKAKGVGLSGGLDSITFECNQDSVFPQDFSKSDPGPAWLSLFTPKPEFACRLQLLVLKCLRFRSSKTIFCNDLFVTISKDVSIAPEFPESQTVTRAPRH